MTVSRRAVLAALGGAALAGCASPGSAVLQIVESYRALDRAKKDYPFSREQILAEPGGVLGVQVEGGLKGVVVWTKRENGLDYWRSGNGVVIVTQNGRLVRTSGFPQDLLASRLVSGVDPLGAPMDPSRSYELRRQIDYRPDQYGIDAVHRISHAGAAAVPLLGETRVLEEWTETVRLTGKRRSYRQILQIDPATGEVVCSNQYVGEKMRVRFELLKAPPADLAGPA